MAEIAGINLGDGLFWANRFGHTPIEGAMVRARDGTPIIWEQQVPLRDFNLTGTNSTGTISGKILSQLSELASIPNGVYTLVHNNQAISVRFRTWEQPVIEASLVGPRENEGETDIYYNVILKLQEA